jgi:arylsulfatase A-like enzyme
MLILVLGLIFLPIQGFCQPLDIEPMSDKRPNILLLVADDLGYSDLGSFGGEINTPNIDQLANNGAKLTNFVAAPTCSPTRAMIMSGTYNHRAGLGAMAEWTSKNQKDKPGYEGYLNDSVVSLPMLLRDSGYSTFIAGKWHLGMKPDQGPDKRGFDKSFVMLPGAGDHFSDRGVHKGLPIVPYRENGKEVALPDNFYSTEFYTDKAIEYIDSAIAKSNPFFGYVAYTAPHWPLQVPKKYSDKYLGKYDAGYESIRSQRLKNLVKQDILSPDIVPHSGSVCFDEWSELPEQKQRYQARLMEIYAGMVDALDENIGRIIQHLEDIDELDNTVIVFLSDNGADARPPLGLKLEAEYVAKEYDNKLNNLGKENSFVSYGGAWALVGSTPFRSHKGRPSEGGIRVPAIVRFPSLIKEKTILREFMSVMDLMPTFLDLAGTSHPGVEYKGRKIWPVEGKSLLPYLGGEESVVHSKPLYGFSIHKRQGLQVGDWKISQLSEVTKPSWELYNLASDPGETENLAHKLPERLQAMISEWEKFTDTGIIVSGPKARAPNECQKI